MFGSVINIYHGTQILRHYHRFRVFLGSRYGYTCGS